MLLGSFQDALWPHANLAFLLCNTNLLMSLLPLLHPRLHNFLVDPPAFDPTSVPPWNPPLPSSQWYSV